MHLVVKAIGGNVCRQCQARLGTTQTMTWHNSNYQNKCTGTTVLGEAGKAPDATTSLFNYGFLVQSGNLEVQKLVKFVVV